MDGLRIAAALWPFQAILIGLVYLHNNQPELRAIMATFILCLLSVIVVLVAWVMVFSLAEPPDLRHPD
jgi:uncharacterized protein with PQ loop repeat